MMLMPFSLMIYLVVGTSVVVVALAVVVVLVAANADINVVINAAAATTGVVDATRVVDN